MVVVVVEVVVENMAMVMAMRSVFWIQREQVEAAEKQQTQLTALLESVVPGPVEADE